MSTLSTGYADKTWMRTATIVTFCFTIFVSASLLFFVQPLYAKLVLPKIGGAPAVWTTAMLFFQVVLIVGYLYAHLLTKWLPLRLQLMTHTLFWLAALTFLPLSTSESWSYDASRSTALQTLELFALGVGLPFAVLSANAPLLQAWYSRSGGPSADDPYFLYSASNVGSLLALLAFPLLADPLLGAQEISNIWYVGFVVFGVLLIVSGIIAIRGPQPYRISPEIKATSLRLSKIQVATWVGVAFVPSSLMLSITTKISTDLGSIPLIWVVPLAIYILSFIVAFAKWKQLTTAGLKMPTLLALALGFILLSDVVHLGYAPIVLLACIPVLFVVALYAHRLLFELRPPAEHLTVFYIALSVGGALGGLFNSIIAPAAFSQEIEAQLTLILAAGLFLIQPWSFSPRHITMGLVVGIAFLVALGMIGNPSILGHGVMRALFAFLTLATILILFRNSALRIALVMTIIMLPSLHSPGNALFLDRSFFGTHQVSSNDGLRVYNNGTTTHGLQREDDFGEGPTPLSYYHPGGPMAQVITSEFGIQSDQIGIVGLGVGALACYKRPSQTWAFFEIDAMVESIARDSSLFTYLTDCAPRSQTYLGDARIVLAQNDFKFDILVLDAYSSDAIPLHLITREAVQMYTDRLSSDGVLVFHISNRYYDLTGPLARIAESLGLHSASQDHEVDPKEAKTGAFSSKVVIMSPERSRIDSFVGQGNWQPLASDHAAPWTDDKANLLSALKWLKAETH
ncbi:spermidine synthase [Ruegeria lacuscaerulensis]|uniref:spermidine synthase n=1 Tax=Ruegeria lacuscaerulensis TaxID=55218 RepID=UPI001F3C3346|nr:fused MFS/spermidine synthase [Ruegeria lacuscaerulensis]